MCVGHDRFLICDYQKKKIKKRCTKIVKSSSDELIHGNTVNFRENYTNPENKIFYFIEG